ncbi:MAG: hypothetical protein A2W90_20990 [Bacteroidetes bacterium GWF2_42_66]|nr:MAG: hypothetical protein A2W92_12335 [Bacteroidetes bacterium GWA2_42_15]OFX99216.1 MAG: hypothetical protein A2W89_03670 [Bacteroidetes bacterium GWE2_42_39]OFY40612.1 MAG: hypothetical protein A2W90_20990 [Bacteroidetes bacterium GWF2_42_66]HBL74567.1 hypothetical protein [Prolixibacteraceae bacterium]HCR88985.1 hypothetical protein [Prolixibacteraceae bacterium]
MFGVLKWSVFPPYAEDEELMIESFGKLLETKCPEFLPSHGTAILVQKDYFQCKKRRMFFHFKFIRSCHFAEKINGCKR